MVIDIATTEVHCNRDVGIEKISFIHPQRFQNLKYIGGGSFGHVVSAEDTANENRKVAIKSIEVPDPATTSKSQSQIKQLIREMVILHKSQNPQIVEFITVYMKMNIDKEPIGVNIVMSHCGINLVDFIWNRRSQTIPISRRYQEAAVIVYNIARGINFLQALDIYHRDLKPSNICIDELDNQFPAKIIDLGMARIKPQESFQLTRKIATVCYRAPEMLLGLKYYGKLDIWSLGCIFGYLISSENIFWYKGKGLNESSGTIQKIFQFLGRPSPRYIEELNQARAVVDRRTFEYLKKCIADSPANEDSVLGDTENSTALEELFPDNPKNTEQREHALELIKGMLQWRGADRWSISQVFESDFLRGVRDENSEALPSRELCQTVTDSIKKYESMLDGKSGDETRDILFNVIAEKFGYDEEVEDCYSYANHRELEHPE